MLMDFMIFFAWVAIVVLPAIVAYRQPVVSHSGYLDSYRNHAGEDGRAAKTGADAATKL